MAGIVIDELITKLEYEYNDAVVKDAANQVKVLEKQNRAAAESADKLSAENQKLAEYTDQLTKAQGDLAEQIADSVRKTDQLAEEQRELAAQAKKAGGATDEQRRRMDQLAGELRKAKQNTSELREENARLGRTKQQVSLESRKLSRAQADVSRSSRKAAADQRNLKNAMREAAEKAREEAAATKSLGDQLKAVGAGQLAADAVKAVGTAAFDLGRNVLESGASFESLRARLKTVEGSSEGAAKAFSLIQDFTRTTPFQLDEVTTAFVRLKSLGLDASKDSLSAFGNIAAAQGKSMIDFIEAVADASTGEFERLKEFGIKASKQGEQVTFTFKGQKTVIANTAKDISGFLKGLGETDFAGAMADQMATTAGAISNFHDTVSQAFDTIAQQGPLRAFNELLQAIASSITDEQGLGQALADVLVAALSTAKLLFDGLSNDKVLGFLQSFMGLFVEIVETLAVFGQLISPILEVWFQWWKILADTAAVVMDLAQIIGELAMQLAEVLGPLLLLVPIFRALFILKVILELLEQFVSWLQRAVQALDPFVATLSNLIDRLPKFADLFDSLTSTVKGFAAEVGLMNSELVATGSVAQAATKALQDLQAAQGDYSQLTMDELQELRKQGGEKGSKAEEEIKRRRKINEDAERQEEETAKQQAQRQKATERAEQAAERFDKMSDTQLQSFATDPNVPKKLRDKAEKEITRRDKKADKDEASSKKRAGKKAQKAKEKLSKSLLTADIDKQFNELAEAAGKRAAARAIARSKGTLTEEQVNEIELTERTQVKARLAGRYEETGQLPPGLAMDLRQTAALPNIEEAGGRLAPPVISIVNNRVEITGNTFEANITVEGGLAGTPNQVATAVASQAMPITMQQLGVAMQNQLTNER